MADHVLSLSYGKDSLACLGAIEQLGLPLDRIVHAEVWATDTIPADLPPMVEFKKKADAIIKERWGIEVEHIYAVRNGEKLTYEKLFYHIPNRKNGGNFTEGSPAGFPYTKGAWCNDRLKTNALDYIVHGIDGFQRHGAGCGATSMLKRAAALHIKSDTTIVQYLGIASDEPERIERHMKKPNVILPLVEHGMSEAMCRKWCEKNDLLSPIYTQSARGGCWFCHNQGVGQLRLLRQNYPDLWALLMKWDLDSPVTFKADGHTVHDFDRRFQLEDEGVIPTDKAFRWDWLERPPGVQMIMEGFT